MTIVDDQEIDVEVEERFAALQQRLEPLWASLRTFNAQEQTIVAVPSLTIDEERSPAVIQAYEERFLFLLLLLRQPGARLIYVTSQPIQPTIVDYYLGLLPGVIASHARPRLHLVSPQDAEPRPLTLKLLARPRLLAHLRDLIPDPERAHLIPYTTTEAERRLAVALGIPMYGADPRFFDLGTKTGGRRLFAEEGVAHPLGIEDLSSLEDLVAAVQRMRRSRPDLEEVLVKLNEGVSGEGNAQVDLRGAGPADADVEARLRSMRFEVDGLELDRYLASLAKRGGVVEERITGMDFRSPSVQMRVTPLRELEVLSTHDQLLGGPSGQSYLGCRFPADPAYATLITDEAVKVGRRLAREGVLGRFAVDFVTVRRADGTWAAFAIELNLRKGGTTHPYLTLQFLTDGRYEPDSGRFRNPSGQEKAFVASDHVELPALRGLTPDDLFDVIVRHGLHFDHGRQRGVVFHMMSAMSHCGRVGLTAVDDSPELADALYHRAVAVLAEEADGSYARV
ncbi:MAG TPA: peptide ligase PGM1-related protein [Acidimicrobiales bacterium]|nr:peptide ligase PGM1-related protein [Acidimicrobiales bacterium]